MPNPSCRRQCHVTSVSPPTSTFPNAPGELTGATLAYLESKTDKQTVAVGGAACRLLAQTYHPDKQPDAASQEAAASQFTRLQEAYEVQGRPHVLHTAAPSSTDNRHLAAVATHTPPWALTMPWVCRLRRLTDDAKQPARVQGRNAVSLGTRAAGLCPPGCTLCFQVLSDPARRLVYDVYGREGLAAGLQVGAKLAGREELKAEWERFQRQRVRRPAPLSSLRQPCCS
jgi:hypothetical protein